MVTDTVVLLWHPGWALVLSSSHALKVIPVMGSERTDVIFPSQQISLTSAFNLPLHNQLKLLQSRQTSWDDPALAPSVM